MNTIKPGLPEPAAGNAAADQPVYIYAQRSPETDELIGRTPPGIVRFGLLIVIAVVLSLVSLAVVMHRNKAVYFELRLRAPNRIATQIGATSQLHTIHARDGDTVQEGQAIIELAGPESVAALKRLDTLVNMIDTSDGSDFQSCVSGPPIRHLEPDFHREYLGLLAAINYRKRSSALLEAEMEIRSRAGALQRMIARWDSVHILRSPCTGIVRLSRHVSSGELLYRGDVIYRVQPLQASYRFLASGYVPDSTQLRVSSAVSLTMMRGAHAAMISGTVEHISNTPVDSGYLVTVSIPARSLNPQQLSMLQSRAFPEMTGKYVRLQNMFSTPFN